MLPNFIVIGAAKCGTTSLCELLGSHPEIYFSNPKEPRYFSNEKYPDQALRDQYEALFSGVTTETAVGEGTTVYTHPIVSALAAERIAATIADCRIIFMVRHPIRRLESDWRMRCHEGWADADINNAIRENWSLVAHSLFWKNFSPYKELFPESKLQIVFLEDFAQHCDAELSRCFAFLGVDKGVKIADADKKRNDSRDFRRDGWLLSRLRQGGALHIARKLAPGLLRQNLKRLFTSEKQYQPSWNRDLHREVVAKCQKDSEELLRYCGKPAGYWELAALP